MCMTVDKIFGKQPGSVSGLKVAKIMKSVITKQQNLNKTKLPMYNLKLWNFMHETFKLDAGQFSATLIS